jgi:hypothetical protein
MTTEAAPAEAEASLPTGFRFVTTWRNLSHDDGERVRLFWRGHEAISDPADVAKRLSQVVMYAIAPDGAIAGVSTALPMLVPRFGQPMYYYRAFIGSAWRTSKLVRDLTNRSCDALEAFARERGFPCIGVLLELENQGFYRALRKPVWWNPRFYYVGKSDRGLEVRAYYFDGARLKSPEEVSRIRLPSHP